MSLRTSLMALAALAVAAPTVHAQQYTRTTLASFNGVNGSAPSFATLTLSGSTLYGTTETGGNLALNSGLGYGVVFSLPVTGGTPTTLATFNGSNGANPRAGVTVIGSTLYGTTQQGGTGSQGTVFSLPLTGGTLSTLVNFSGSNGGYVDAGLTLSKNGSTLYGATYVGGTSGVGTIFSLPVGGGAPTTLATFGGSSGANPFGTLTLSPDGSTLYGTTVYGGGLGTVFSVPVTGGTPTTLTTFTDANGKYPYAGVSISPDGTTLYGTTYQGGTAGKGTVFSLPATGGTPTTLVTFNGSNGANPFGGLTLSGSTLYGTTSGGGASNSGTVFSVSVTGGTPTTLATFTGLNGDSSSPFAGLTQSGSTFYGTTYTGGTDSHGTVFALAAAPEPSQWAAFLVGVLGLSVLTLRASKRPA